MNERIAARQLPAHIEDTNFDGIILVYIVLYIVICIYLIIRSVSHRTEQSISRLTDCSTQLQPEQIAVISGVVNN